ncbi:MAG: helix-turn-helix domain-containing protein, partial [Alphaproteobacteria bacterium]
REAVGRGATPIEARTLASRPFAGTIASRALADFRLMRFESAGHVIARTRPAGVSTGAHLLVSLQVGGEARLVQGGCHVEVGAGSGAVGLLDTARPFELSFPDEVGRIFFFVPHAALRARAPWLERTEPVSLGPDNPVAAILREYMLRIGDPASAFDDRTALILLDGFVGALAVASAIQRAGTDNWRALRRDAVRAHMRHGLSDPGMSPATVARAFGLSTRSVHKLFEGSGASFGAWLLGERLEACASALSAAGREMRIADIAFGAGFNDISHFNRSFKARFKATPRQWRFRAPRPEAAS